MVAKAKARRRARTDTPPRRARSGPDIVLVMVVGTLLTIGLIMVYSATFYWSYDEYGNSFHFWSRQVLWVVVGLIALGVVSAIPYDCWQRLAVPAMGLTLLSLILVLFVGDEIFGARRTFFNGSIQPGEMAKLAMVVYVATWLTSKGDQIRDVTYGLVPFAVLIGVVAGLIVMQPDVSTAILVVLTALAMFFVAGADIFQLAAGGTVSVSTFALLIGQLPHAKDRLLKWVAFWRDPMGGGYHIVQALTALGHGGLFGVGLGQGQQKLHNLPAPHTDSIFAALGEETGLVGCLVVLGLFVLLAWRGFRIALGATDPFAALLACGVTYWLSFQALTNVGVMTGLMPSTGIALPFISSGGSAMVASLIGVGLLLSVSRGRQIRGRSEKRVREGRGLQRAHLDRRWGNRGTRLSGTGRHTGSTR